MGRGEGGLLALPLHPGYQKASALGAPFTCSFEGTTCGWEDISNSAYRWDPAQASISTWGLEPPFDHTLGTDFGNRFCWGRGGEGHRSWRSLVRLFWGVGEESSSPGRPGVEAVPGRCPVLHPIFPFAFWGLLSPQDEQWALCESRFSSKCLHCRLVHGSYKAESKARSYGAAAVPPVERSSCCLRDPSLVSPVGVR